MKCESCPKSTISFICTHKTPIPLSRSGKDDKFARSSCTSQKVFRQLLDYRYFEARTKGANIALLSR